MNIRYPKMLSIKLGLVASVATLWGLALSCVARNAYSDEPFRDKTLVAWASPANLTQRGGSILTINDNADRFDGIVFGEIAEARWMAGSDLFRRTTREQNEYPVETEIGRAHV